MLSEEWCRRSMDVTWRHRDETLEEGVEEPPEEVAPAPEEGVEGPPEEDAPEEDIWSLQKITCRRAIGRSDTKSRRMADTKICRCSLKNQVSPDTVTVVLWTFLYFWEVSSTVPLSYSWESMLRLKMLFCQVTLVLLWRFWTSGKSQLLSHCHIAESLDCDSRCSVARRPWCCCKDYVLQRSLKYFLLYLYCDVKIMLVKICNCLKYFPVISSWKIMFIKIYICFLIDC